MRIQLLRLRSDEGQVKTDVLVERSANVGEEWDEQTTRAMNEVFTALDAMRAAGSHPRVLVALEPDEE